MSLPSGSALASSPILPASPTYELESFGLDFWLPVDRVSTVSQCAKRYIRIHSKNTPLRGSLIKDAKTG